MTIPSASTWPIGAAVLADRAHLVVKFAHDLGIIKKDSRGKDYVPIPGFAPFVNKLLGGLIADGLVRIERDTLTVTDPEALERRAAR